MTRAQGNDLHDLELYLHWEADGALLVSDTGIKEQAVWLPKSLIEFEKIGAAPGARLVSVKVAAPEWLLVKKGLL